MLMTMPLNFAQTTQRARLYLGISLAKLVLQLSINIVFVVVLPDWCRRTALQHPDHHLVLGCGLTVWLLRQTGIHFDRQVVRDLRRFGVPYQLTWAGELPADVRRPVLPAGGTGRRRRGTLQYGVPVRVPAVAAGRDTIPERVESAPAPAGAPPEGGARPATTTSGFFYFNLLLITVAMGIAVFIRPVIKVMTTPEFHPAAYLVPIILLAYVAEAWAEVFRFAFDVTERTRYSTYATWIVVAVVLVLYTRADPALRRLRGSRGDGARILAPGDPRVPVGAASLADSLSLAASPDAAGARRRRGHDHLGDAEHDHRGPSRRRRASPYWCTSGPSTCCCWATRNGD